MVLGGGPFHRLVAAEANGLRERNRRDFKLRAFHGRRDGTRIGHVVSDVLAAIDAGQDEIEFAPLDDMADGHQHTVGGRAAHRELARREPAHTDRIGKAQRMRRTALLLFGRNHPDIGGETERDLFEHLEARRIDAVIVGDENAEIRVRGFSCSGFSHGGQ